LTAALSAKALEYYVMLVYLKAIFAPDHLIYVLGTVDINIDYRAALFTDKMVVGVCAPVVSLELLRQEDLSGKAALRE